MKLCVFFVIAVMFSAAAALTEAEISEKWESYKTQFGKKYDDKEEEMRKGLFTETLKLIEAHNKKFENGEVSYTLGINQFADLTDDEKKSYHGLIRPTKN